MTVAHRPDTAEELLPMPDGVVRHGLVPGEASPAGNVHGRAAARFPERLFRHTGGRRLVAAFAAGTGFEIASNPDTVRAPDVALVRREGVRKVGEVRGYRPGAVNLAVEVASPNASYARVEEKVAAWPEAGTSVGVEPRARNVMVRSSRAERRVLAEGDVRDVVDGRTMPVADVFG